MAVGVNGVVVGNVPVAVTVAVKVPVAVAAVLGFGVRVLVAEAFGSGVKVLVAVAVSLATGDPVNVAVGIGVFVAGSRVGGKCRIHCGPEKRAGRFRKRKPAGWMRYSLCTCPCA